MKEKEVDKEKEILKKAVKLFLQIEGDINQCMDGCAPLELYECHREVWKILSYLTE